jgi:excinuclease ABC subunit B
VNGLVIMYADRITDSMQQTIYETDRRRSKQMEYNKLHGITPTQVGVKKNVLLEGTSAAEGTTYGKQAWADVQADLGGKQRNPRLANSVTGRVSAANSYDDPTYIPDPTDLGRGSVSVGLGHDSKRETNSAYVEGYIHADLAAVLQDPVIRSMTRPQVEKAVEQARKNMQKAASDLDFMAAAKYRDEMWALQQYLKVWRD